ncbi:unnamed protein product [Vitrella brassicaformis CCMP3155]|uniref:Uncharacterized protein n=1 Tax=Vitrella brassicaformis (strain CCMP3155) TaxID=1169540 RepID=A0A0G4EXQ8_VITBC|nr:unnamed protein product [Vitrella brassicaformis CCMP3155]|eukprot:CEM03185.1 unnamed protein product [Vitrella brassicaformis CCMP3155]
MEEDEQQRQHPFTYIFVGRRTFFLLSLNDILRLRETCTWARDLFGAPQLRQRLAHSLSSQAGLRRVVHGRQVQLLRFDDDQFSVYHLLAAVYVMEEGRWVEVGEVIELAAQCGCCELPVIVTADDIDQHENKTAYRFVARVLAQLMVVGRHINFGDSRLQIFRRADGEVRAIKDEPGFRFRINPFRIFVDPPLPAGHLYQQHRLQHDPPVHSWIRYFNGIRRWDRIHLCTYASVSSFAKGVILDHFDKTHQTNGTLTTLHRRVGGGRLDGLLTQSPHTPVAGCTTTLSSGGRLRYLVLTNSSHDFVAWIAILNMGNDNVRVSVLTTEAPVRESGAFKDCLPVTAQLGSVALGSGLGVVFDGQVEQHEPSEPSEGEEDDDDDDSDGHGGGWDDMDDDSDGEGSRAEEDNDEDNGDNER